MEKSPDAFRTISEVADWLGVPTHVLRFWESRFSQVKPVKRAGGRRYYRPADMALLGGIKRLLHDDGMTIRGVQKMLREEGVKHVSSFSQPLDTTAPMRDVTPEAEDVAPSPMAVDVEPEPVDNVVPIASPPAAEAEAVELAEQAPAPEDVAADAERAHLEDDTTTTHAADTAATASSEDDDSPGEEVLSPETDDTTEQVPELSFLRRPAAPEADTGVDAPLPPGSPEADLFTSRRPAEPSTQDEPARPSIPATPDIPARDASDDDPSTPAFPGLAARIIANRLRPDHAAIARAVSDLRDLRARL